MNENEDLMCYFIFVFLLLVLDWLYSIKYWVFQFVVVVGLGWLFVMVWQYVVWSVIMIKVCLVLGVVVIGMC